MIIKYGHLTLISSGAYIFITKFISIFSTNSGRQPPRMKDLKLSVGVTT